MSERPLVSVITPAYNTASYIGAAIRSALAQTIDAIEMIIVDDGSSDGTCAEAMRCAAGDPRVRVVTQQNAGPSTARNRAMALARGEFFACLDSDDEWMPRFLEVQLEAFARHPSAGVVTGNAINRGGRLDGTPYRALQPQDRALSFLYMLQHENAVCITSVFRRRVYDLVGPFNVTLSGNEDYEFWLRAAAHGVGVVQTFEPLAYYRRRPDSASADERKMTAGILRVFGMARQWCRTPEEHAAVDAQVARYECELLDIDARAALRTRDFKAAAACYERLHQRAGGTRLAAMTFTARCAPRLLLWLADARRAVRNLKMPVAEA